MGSTWGNAVIGAASLLAGLWLLLKPAARSRRSPPAKPALAPIRFHRRSDSLPPLFFGAALTPIIVLVLGLRRLLLVLG